MYLGFAMAGVLGIPVLVLVQEHTDWQTSAIGSGLLIWAMGFPCSRLLRTRSEPYGLRPDGDILDVPSTNEAIERYDTMEYDFTLREAIRTPAFWFSPLGQLGTGAVQVHLFLHLEQGIGLTQKTAALVWAVASISNIPSRLLGGFFGDRLPKHLIVGFSMVLIAASAFILGIATSVPMALLTRYSMVSTGEYGFR